MGRIRQVLSPQQRRRRRRVWTAATGALTAFWLSSALWYAEWHGSRAAAAVGAGAVAVEWRQAGGTGDLVLPPGVWCGLFRADSETNDVIDLDLWRKNSLPSVSYRRGGFFECSIPIWVFLVPMLVPLTRAWLAKASPSACHTCGYDRAGLAAGVVCPECGAAPPPASLAAAGSTTPTR